MKFKTRLIFFLIGLTILGFGIAMLVTSDFGVGPWDLVYIGLSNKIGVSIGICMNIAAIIHIILASLISKKVPQFLSLVTSFVIGMFVDFWMLFFRYVIVDTVYLKLLLFFTSLIIMSLGACIYLKAKFPVSPLDYLMLTIFDRFKISLSTSKILCELSGFIIGLALGGPFGIGTIIILFSIGPLIQFFENPVNKIYKKFETIDTFNKVTQST